MNPRDRSKAIYQEARRLLVGGVNSPVRAFKAVGGEPFIISRANGARITDADGNEYVDFVCSWGAMILGHAHPAVTRAIQEQAALGTSYGMTNELEVELARRVQQAFPSMERIRFVSSGTEATMSAIRAARAFTKRNLIVKFEGCYHGHADSFLSEAGSGLATLGIAESPGVPQQLAVLTRNVPYNDARAVVRAFEALRHQIAAVIVEPVAANMGVVAPGAGFLADLREITRKNGALLIFDEVITGFRVAPGGAQSLYGVTPDLTTLGKIIGGGLPVGAYGGRADIMEQMAPLGPVYQAGTLSGNPLAMRAGLETLRQLEAPGFYDQLNDRSERLAGGLRQAIAEAGVPAVVNSAGSLLTLFFVSSPVRDYSDAKRSDTRRFAAFFQEMLARGVFLPPSQFEAWFVSAAHTEECVDQTVHAARASVKAALAGNAGR
jgi:glutamate-1-semialdehyde 2,1-aminomutase